MFATLQSFYRHTRITPPKERWTGQSWRLADQTVGHLRGCPHLRGVACATDGVLLLVLLESGEVARGHLDNWIPDACESRNIQPRRALAKRAAVLSPLNEAITFAFAGLLE